MSYVKQRASGDLPVTQGTQPRALGQLEGGWGGGRERGQGGGVMCIPVAES